MTEDRRGKPSKLIFQQFLSAASVRLATNDYGIEFGALKRIEQFTREADPDIEIETWIECAHARQYGR